MEKKTTSDRLKELMRINNWKQVDLIAITHFPKSAVSQYVSGKRLPRQDKLTVIADACHVSEAWLMGYNVPMEKAESTIDNVTLTLDEANVLQMYSELNDNGKKYIKEQLENAVQLPKYIVKGKGDAEKMA